MCRDENSHINSLDSFPHIYNKLCKYIELKHRKVGRKRRLDIVCDEHLGWIFYA